MFYQNTGIFHLRTELPFKLHPYLWQNYNTQSVSEWTATACFQEQVIALGIFNNLFPHSHLSEEVSRTLASSSEKEQSWESPCGAVDWPSLAIQPRAFRTNWTRNSAELSLRAATNLHTPHKAFPNIIVPSMHRGTFTAGSLEKKMCRHRAFGPPTGLRHLRQDLFCASGDSPRGPQSLPVTFGGTARGVQIPSLLWHCDQAANTLIKEIH